MNVGEKIRNRRRELGLTQTELAEKVGFKTKSAIYKIEQGYNDVNQEKLAAIALALNTTPGFLMGWEEHDKGNDLMAIWESLNEQGKELLMDYANDLLNKPKYKKDTIESVTA